MDAPPTWDDLEVTAAEKGWTGDRRMAMPFRSRERSFSGTVPPVPGEGVMVFWRDVFNWCPFCVPTQLLLEEKRIPYVAKKVPLNGYSAPAGEKDPEFLRRVPPKNGNTATSLVPDLTLDFQGPRERTIIAENGHDLLDWIEQNFPNHEPRMTPPEGTDPGLIEEYYRRENALLGAMGAYLAAEDGEPLSTARGALLEHLDKLEVELGRCPDGPFLFGEAFTIPDIRLISWLERIDVLPAHFKGERLLTGSPAPSRFLRIEAWLEAVRARPAYRDIRLDNESLCVAHQTGATALRKTALPYNLAGASAGSGAAPYPPPDPLAGPVASRGWGSEAAVEAAHSLVFARDGVFSLAGKPPRDTDMPTSDRLKVRLAGGVAQAAADAPSAGGLQAAADRALRTISAALMEEGPQELSRLQHQVEQDHRAEVASGLCFLRNRIQVPRDVSHAAAATLRETLLTAASILVGEEHALGLILEHQSAFVSRRNIRSRF